MSKGRKQVKQKGPNARLGEQVNLLEGRVRGLETALAECSARLDALEVVKVPSPTTTEPAPEEPQLPQTE